MPPKNKSLHGQAPDQSSRVMLIIDVFTDFKFEGGAELFKKALPVAKRIAQLKEVLCRQKIPCIYVNDNIGRWRSDFSALIEHCRKSGSKGKAIVDILKPTDKDYLILKPKHSAFYSTNLSTLLIYLEAKTLILTGFGGNQCILFSANDAYLRDYHLVTPRNCLATQNPKDHQYALRHLKITLDCDISPWKMQRQPFSAASAKGRWIHN